jgi:hypothetical protein
VDGDAITNGLSVNHAPGNWLQERVAGPGFDGILQGEVGANRGTMGAEVRDGLE